MIKKQLIRNDNDRYDAIIIGAGIGGLVCGCYLAKAGMKVLICEQHYKPGGYCTSFKRQAFTFDAGPHCFGSYREGGIARKILRELEVDGRLSIIRPDPTDAIITPDYTLFFWNDLERTILEFQSAFHDEGDGIRNFFHSILSTDPDFFSQLRHWTFKEMLDNFIKSATLKTILSFPLLGICGLPPWKISAFIGAKLFSEFLLDGGYYPQGGMQALPDALAGRFGDLGGELRLTTLVKSIQVKDNQVRGIILEDGHFISSKYVISNCDARLTFLDLLGKNKIEKKFAHKLKNMTPSISNFILYLGCDKKFNPSLKAGTTFCFFPHYNLDRAYKATLLADLASYGGYMIRVSHDKSAIIAMIPASYKNATYWKTNKHKFLNSFVERIEKYSLPHLSEHIKCKEAATPHTLHRYTLNYRGASFGWAATPSQLAVPDLRRPSFISGLFLTGHWTTLGTGVSGVAYVGCDTAKIILRKEHQ